jgi:hypothetical protein
LPSRGQLGVRCAIVLLPGAERAGREQNQYHPAMESARH